MCEQLSGWTVTEDGHGYLRLRQQYRMKSFLKALELCDRIAEVAEAEGHHPDVHVTGWNRLAVELWTHSRHGLTENDYIMAAKIDAIPKDDLLGGKKKKFGDI
ncbi:Putative pterin-4-alpha-carbinolamine dehydratase [Auxenochlorella protothecoides]|uniref:4a-hydroxytetrahydrobiopterin dehydratase n=1 Tax=Auxenochlorella protothecoides TaxID=3075 RepID=A0A087SH47_AUXPR|nr:Putative pterin-4-alpha-carbinolamine dehydratase [Auxenochlorella protothecoides]KFM25051.1 Putative pterin-4-alpha-carbinolamine dehydratase [Auxenochlorella protothecoides]